MSYEPQSFKITEIKDFTKDVKLFKIKSNLNPKPGQFIEVSIPGIGECPLASCSYNKDFIDMLTRNAGNVTSALFKLKKGENVFIRGPYGKGFPIEELKNHNLIMIAGGTGIAPVTSLIEFIENNRQDFKKVFIYFGFRNEKYVLLKEKIKKWKKEFNLFIGLSNANKEKIKDNEFGFEIGFVQDIMEKHKPETENTIALLCGPEPMMDCVTNELNKLNIKNNKIYWSMERRMECGIGNCGRCLIQDVYVCKDGPIFRYDFIKPRLENENSNNIIENRVKNENK
jgi:anaerobic sulfite reductase subunit B